ncbi:nucleolar protein 16 [Prorops nasuta]|uniref:nucleolar protein 16 n=1 Tax=Prorops nasuta TaxID=863751 RepID=UPI0034CF2D58
MKFAGHGVNRKRLRNKLKRLPIIKCAQMKQEWEVTKSTRLNLRDMGLAYDPNEVLKIPNIKEQLLKKVINERNDMQCEWKTEDISKETNIAKKSHVAKELEAEARAPRERLFKLPKGQVQFLTYLLDKYGEDYKAMARDKKNHYQMTWKQIRAKINKFKSIPEQYNEYLHSKSSLSDTS